MSLLTYTSMPPPFRFRCGRRGEKKPSIRKLDFVNVSFMWSFQIQTKYCMGLLRSIYIFYFNFKRKKNVIKIKIRWNMAYYTNRPWMELCCFFCDLYFLKVQKSYQGQFSFFRYCRHELFSNKLYRNQILVSCLYQQYLCLQC